MSVRSSPHARRLFRCGFAALAVTLLGASCTRLPNLADEEAKVAPLAQTTMVFDAKGRLMTELHSVENRTIVRLDQIPKVTRRAVIAIEDERFWHHHGVDVKALLRAAYENVKSGRIVQGGSTITEQLVKNTITGGARTIDRKFREAVLAYQLEDKISKKEILERYLNTVYLGQGAYGFEAAAKTYFSAPASELNLSQSALLAGLIRSPSTLNPVYHRGAAKTRRNLVLSKMHSLGWISDAEFRRATRSKLKLRLQTIDERYPAPYFVDYVKQWFLGNPRFGATRDARRERLFRGGLRIHTTLDLELQRYAEEAIRSVLAFKSDPYGAMTVLDPRSGAIRAMVGGRNYFAKRTQDHFAKLNLALGGSTGRQAGSSFKVFALVAALENGIPPQTIYNSPGNIKIPLPPDCQGENEPFWDVSNYDGGEVGRFTLEQGTIDSINVVYAQVIRDLGHGDPCEGGEKIVEVAKRMGIWGGPTHTLRSVPSAVLGTNEVGTLEMASAYGTLATTGRRYPPMAVTKITDAEGHLLYEASPKGKQVVNPGVAWTADEILQKVVQFGTGYAASLPRPAAGKTGTAQEWRDAWFIGFVPQLVAAVWVGFPEGQVSMVYPRVRIPHVLGGTWPAQIWHAFMVNATRDMPVMQFERPELEWVSVRIDITRACLANEFTLPQNVRTIQLIKGTEENLRNCGDKAAEIAVPSVVGLREDEARSTLESYGFDVAVAEEKTDAASPGTVIRQSPSGGAIALQGTTVTITVARAPKKVSSDSMAKVPSVLGMVETQAAAKLRNAGFRVEVIEQWQCQPPSSCGAIPKRVWRQSPPGGTKAKTGSTVTIWANKGSG